MEEGKVNLTSAEDIKRDRPEVYVCATTGRSFEIRKLYPAQLALSGVLKVPIAGLIETMHSVADKQQAGTALDEFETAQVNLYLDAIVCLGVVSVRVVDKPTSECADDEVSIDELRLERDELADAITKKSGWDTLAASQRSVVSTVRAGESFRPEESADSGGGAASG